MTTFAQRTTTEQELIRKAYEFEILAINEDNADRNPYYDAIITMVNGRSVWEGINLAVELAFS